MALVRRHRSGNSYRLWIYAGSLVVEVVLSVSLLLVYYYEFAKESAQKRRNAILTQPRTVEGLTLPTGTDLTYRDADLTQLESARLPSPSLVAGLPLTGDIKSDDRAFDVTLAVDSIVSGIPCRAGDLQLTKDVKISNCTLSRQLIVNTERKTSEPKAPSLLFPSSTYVYIQRDDGAYAYNFRLPKNKAMKLPELTTGAPKGSTVMLYSNGAIYGVDGDQNDMIYFRGIRLDADLFWVYPERLSGPNEVPVSAPIAIFGSLAHDLSCDGKVFRPAAARIDLHANSIIFIGLDEHDNRQESVPFAISHCHLAPARHPASSIRQ